MATSGASGTQAVERAAGLVAIVVEADEPVSFTALSDSSGLARSTTSRLLAAMERSHLLARDGDGNYRPGSLFARYAARNDPSDELVELCGPVLDQLRDDTGETANLGVPQGNTVLHLAQADSRYLLGTQDWTQADVPVHVSALGRVLQAHGALPVADEPMVALTPASIVDPRQLVRELARVARRGYALTVDELEIGLTGIAAPVRGPSGEVIAAIGVSGPTARLKSRVGPVGRLLVEQAEIVSAQLHNRHHKEGAA